MDKLFTPKQVGQALGVSESSVKRWCDSGRVRAARTAGGHRKVPLSAIVNLIRETGHDVPCPEVLGLVTANRGAADPATGRDTLYASLIAGDESACRDMVLGYYQRGHSIVELGDNLIGPVMRRVGYNWESEEIRVHHERRASMTIVAALHELRQWLPPVDADAPLALCATAMQDFAETPIRLVEIMLRESGWNTAMAGAGLPVEEIAEAIKVRNPRLVCLSLTHLGDTEDYVRAHNAIFTPDLLTGRRLVVGGNALDMQCASQLTCDLYARTMANLQPLLAKWAAEAVSAAG